MTNDTTQILPGYVRKYTIDEKKRFITENDVGQDFVRTMPRPFGPKETDWSYTPAGSSEEKIRSYALKLTACNKDGSMNFSDKWVGDSKHSASWNDGN